MTSPHPAKPAAARGWPVPESGLASGPGEGDPRRVGIVCLTLHTGGFTAEADVRALGHLIDVAEFDMATRTERGWLVDTEVAAGLMAAFWAHARPWWRMSTAPVA